MAQVRVIDGSGKPTQALELRPEVFGVEVRVPLLHQAVTRELAARRAGTHDTRGRSEVSGGGKKPWRQKGTGRARQGSIRATQWKGGGKPFGPTPRSYEQNMPRRARREALRAAVSAKVAADEVIVVDRLDAEDGKTRTLVGRLAALGVADTPTLIVVTELAEPLARAARNVPWITVEAPSHASVYQFLRHSRVVFERAALLELQDALARDTRKTEASAADGDTGSTSGSRGTRGARQARPRRAAAPGRSRSRAARGGDPGRV